MSVMIVRSTKEGGVPHRLSNITTQFVALVRAGANRQSKFFVVKEDEAADDPDDPNDIVPPEDLTGDQRDEDKNKGKGGDAEGAPGADLGAWLDVAGNKADRMLTDATLDESMAAPTLPPSSPEPPIDKALKVGNDRSAPSEDEEMEQMKGETEALRQKLRKSQDELKAERLRNQRMTKAAVGGTTALVTGMVGAAETTADTSEVVSEGKRKAWGAGGDLAK